MLFLLLEEFEKEKQRLDEEIKQDMTAIRCRVGILYFALIMAMLGVSFVIYELIILLRSI